MSDQISKFERHNGKPPAQFDPTLIYVRVSGPDSGAGKLRGIKKTGRELNALAPKLTYDIGQVYKPLAEAIDGSH